MVTDPEVKERVELARAKGEVALLDTLSDCVDSGRNPSGAMWTLERLYPKHYHLPKVVEHSGPNGGPQQTQTVVKISYEDAQKIARRKYLK